MHSFISEVEALKHCDREKKGCDCVFGGRIVGERFGGRFSGGRLMDTLDLKEKDRYAGGGNFRRSFEQRFVRQGGPGGPGEGAFGPGMRP